VTRLLFLDTSAWFAALSAKEYGHTLCRQAYREAIERGAALLTTSLVVAEMHVLLSRRVSMPFARRFLEALNDDQHEVVCPDAEFLWRATSRWIARYPDQDFSLCDAVSFEVMRARRVTKALALDHHFTIAGYETAPAGVDHSR